MLILDKAIDFFFIFKNCMHEITNYRELSHGLDPIKVKRDPLKALIEISHLLLDLIHARYYGNDFTLLVILDMLEHVFDLSNTLRVLHLVGNPHIYHQVT